jgi:hypothetical protein
MVGVVANTNVTAKRLPQVDGPAKHRHRKTSMTFTDVEKHFEFLGV